MITMYEYKIIIPGFYEDLKDILDVYGTDGFYVVGATEKYILMEREIWIDEHQEEIQKRLDQILDRQGQKR